MPKEKPGNHHVLCGDTLHSEHFSIDQAKMAASAATGQAMALGSKAIYVAIEGPYSFGE